MNHDALVKRGRLPWSPTPEARDLDVWHEYEVPLIGTFEVEGEIVLFTSVGDPDDRLSVWAYTTLGSGDGGGLAPAEFDSVADMHAFISDTFER